MEIKLFGKSLFSAKKNRAEILWGEATSPKMTESKFLPDFHNKQGSFGGSNWTESYVVVESSTGGSVAVPQSMIPKKGKKGLKIDGRKVQIQLTPKGVYEGKFLNDDTFVLNTNEKYVDGQLADFKEKLTLIKSEEYDMKNGVEEISSMIQRLENRKKYPEVKEFFEKLPYTTSSKIAQITKTHDNLQLGQIAQFVADLPKEAVDIMKEYNENTKKVCGKQAVFYIIADKKDFKKSESRRDPILLAQSPFGHIWQILGAWDKEMMFLEEL